MMFLLFAHAFHSLAFGLSVLVILQLIARPHWSNSNLFVDLIRAHANFMHMCEGIFHHNLNGFWLEVLVISLIAFAGKVASFTRLAFLPRSQSAAPPQLAPATSCPPAPECSDCPACPPPCPKLECPPPTVCPTFACPTLECPDAPAYPSTAGNETGSSSGVCPAFVPAVCPPEAWSVGALQTSQTAQLHFAAGCASACLALLCLVYIWRTLRRIFRRRGPAAARAAGTGKAAPTATTESISLSAQDISKQLLEAAEAAGTQQEESGFSLKDHAYILAISELIHTIRGGQALARKGGLDFKRCCLEAFKSGFVVMLAVFAYQIFVLGTGDKLGVAGQCASARGGVRSMLVPQELLNLLCWVAQWFAAKRDVVMGILMLCCVPVLVKRLGLTEDYQWHLVLVFGAACGFPCYMAIRRLGGDEFVWGLLWAAWVSAHFLLSLADPSGDLNLLGLRGVRLAAGSGGVSPAVWLLLVLALPIAMGIVPYLPPSFYDQLPGFLPVLVSAFWKPSA